MRIADKIEKIGTVENGQISGFIFNDKYPQIIPEISANDPLIPIGIAGLSVGDSDGNINVPTTKMICGYTAWELQKLAEYNSAAISLKI